MAPGAKISNHFERGKLVIQKCWLSTVTNNLPRGLRTCSWKNKFLTVTLFVCSFVGSRNESMCKFFLKNWRKVLNVKAVVKKWLERLNERHRSIDWINVIDGVGASLLWNALTSKKTTYIEMEMTSAKLLKRLRNKLSRLDGSSFFVCKVFWTVLLVVPLTHAMPVSSSYLVPSLKKILTGMNQIDHFLTAHLFQSFLYS